MHSFALRICSVSVSKAEHLCLLTGELQESRGCNRHWHSLLPCEVPFPIHVQRGRRIKTTNLRYVAWKYIKCKHYIYVIRYNYYKHHILFKMEKNFQKPMIIEVQFWGKKSIQINLTPIHNSENLWRWALFSYSIQVNTMAKGRGMNHRGQGQVPEQS